MTFFKSNLSPINVQLDIVALLMETVLRELPRTLLMLAQKTIRDVKHINTQQKIIMVIYVHRYLKQELLLITSIASSLKVRLTSDIG